MPSSRLLWRLVRTRDVVDGKGACATSSGKTYEKTAPPLDQVVEVPAEADVLGRARVEG